MLAYAHTTRFLQLIGASGVAVTGAEYLAQVSARAAPAVFPNGSNGIQHVVLVMLENRSFDHLLGWLPDANGRADMVYQAPDGNFYPNYPLAPDFQGCGYSDPDRSWEGWLVEYNFGRMDGFLQRPTAFANNPDVTLAAANTYPVGFYTNLNRDGTPKAVPDLPVLGALAQHYTVLDHYFCSFAGETFPNRSYQHAARTDRDHNSLKLSTLATIWDQLSPIPNTKGVPTGAYFFRNAPYLAIFGGLKPLTARDANAMNLAQVLNRHVTAPVPPSAIPTSSEVPRPAGDAAAVCSAASVQSVSPAPAPGRHGHAERVPAGGYPTRLGMGPLVQHYRKAPLR